MSVSVRVFPIICASIVTLSFTANGRAQSTLAPRILSAKTAYFEDRTGSTASGAKTLAQLGKWARFQIVQDPARADLILELSAGSEDGGHVILASGQTGTITVDGAVVEDLVPNYSPIPAARYAFLTVFDARTGAVLWRSSHRWGGLLTGFDSAGARLVKQLQNQAK